MKGSCGGRAARPCTYPGFWATAQQPCLGAPGTAAALSESRKALGTGAEGCPVGVFLAPPGLRLQSPRPRWGHCPPRGLLPGAPAPRPRPPTEGARATCRVWGEGRAGPHLCAPRPRPRQASRRARLTPPRPPTPSTPGAALGSPRGPNLGPPLQASPGRRRPARFRKGHVARAPAGAPWRRGWRGSRPPAQPSGGNCGPSTWRWRHPLPLGASLSFADTHTPEGRPRGLPASLYCT